MENFFSQWYFRETGREVGRKEREREIDVRSTLTGCLSQEPQQGVGREPRTHPI